MSLGKFLKSRAFLINLLIAVVLVTILLVATMQALKLYTHHGSSYPVPNFTGIGIEEAIEKAQAGHLKIEVIDSVYNKKFNPGEIVDQQPVANSKVKQNRTIFITINSLEPETVVLPKLTDISYRQAQVLIENCGLFIGNLSYQPSEYNDLVLEVQQDSSEVFAGDKIIKGSNVDLIIGRSKGNLKTPLPNLTGFTIEEAESILTDAKLNQGVLIYDNTIETAEDSLNAKVWKQAPNPKFVSLVELGSSIDLWLTIDSVKVNKAYDQ